jgi:TolB protein
MRRLMLAVALATASAAADDGTARRIVGGVGSSAMPAWTPAGDRIVFHSRRKSDKEHDLATRNVWSVAADGAAEQRITKGNKDEYHASLSPDGKRLLFVSEVNGSRDVWIADADGQNAVPLTDDPGTEDQPAWASDSRRIVYAAFPKEGGSFDLWAVNADGSNRRRLTTTPANEIFPAWHPNGEDIAYVTDASGNFDLYRMTLRDGATSPLVVSPAQEARPAWSPDGTKLAFARWPAHGRSTDTTLWVANADGTTPIELTAAPPPATHPAWAPDGRTLAFQHRTGPGWEIWTLALPSDIADAGRLRLAQQVRGGADVDTARLRSGDTLRGTVGDTRFRVRTAYGALDLPRAAVGSIVFGSAERGLARIVLANGDTVSGFVETGEIRLTANGRAQPIAMERVAELSLRGARPAAADGGFRAVMRNGDSVLVRSGFGPLRLRVGDGTTTLDASRLERVDFDEAGERATAVLRSGDSVSGKLPDDRIELTLALGPRLMVHPSQIRTLARITPPAPAPRPGG